jgi:probable addiction module antidote protein
MAVTFAPYVPGEYMTTPERVVAFLKLSFEEDKPEEIAESLGIVARSAGMTEIARRSGLSRESLYRALSPDGKPQLETIMRVLPHGRAHSREEGGTRTEGACQAGVNRTFGHLGAPQTAVEVNPQR